MANQVINKNKTTSFTYTENGALCLSSSGQALVDLYATIGAIRNTSDDNKIELFEKAIAENKELATKILFYGRDIREGLGERDTFRKLLAYSANRHKEIVAPNIPLIGFYGRFDDLYCLLNTDLEDEMWKYMKEQFEADLKHMKAGESVSLLAKWIKTPDASSANTRKLGILTSQKLGYKNVGAFKKDLRALRKYLDILEIKLSANDFASIAYNQVPSNAMHKYRKVFARKDTDRFNKYIADVTSGKTEIKSNTLYPYDIIKPLIRSYGCPDDLSVLEAQWKALPNYVEPNTNILVMADTSGSMDMGDGMPMASAIGLGMYFAERNTGVFKNYFMTFSTRPQLVKIEGNTLFDKVKHAMGANWNGSTDLAAALDLILDTAVANNTPQEALPKALVIISDMQFNICARNNKTYYDTYKEKFEQAGYTIPNIVFWNVRGSNTFHAKANVKGVQMVSGSAASSFKAVIDNLDKTAFEAMLEVILSDRYAAVTVAA